MNRPYPRAVCMAVKMGFSLDLILCKGTLVTFDHDKQHGSVDALPMLCESLHDQRDFIPPTCYEQNR